jgi:hypothetical protein
VPGSGGEHRRTGWELLSVAGVPGNVRIIIDVRAIANAMTANVVGTTWAPSVAHEPRVMPTTPRGVSYFAPSLFVITVLAALALRMSVTRLALACCAAAPLWVEAAATIAVRSASTRPAAPVTV